MDRTFAKKCQDTRSDEYIHLQGVRRDYPDYRVITREIKRNPDKRTYKGLTYAFIEEYILSHGSDAEVQQALSKYRELRQISKCHQNATGYSVIKKWFLDTYQEIEDFGTAA